MDWQVTLNRDVGKFYGVVDTLVARLRESSIYVMHLQCLAPALLVPSLGDAMKSFWLRASAENASGQIGT